MPHGAATEKESKEAAGKRTRAAEHCQRVEPQRLGEGLGLLGDLRHELACGRNHQRHRPVALGLRLMVDRANAHKARLQRLGAMLKQAEPGNKVGGNARRQCA